MKTKLFVDFDGVIVNAIKAYCETYNHYYKDIPGFRPADHELVDNWNLSEQCPLAQNNVENIFGDSYFFEVVEFMDYAYKSLLALSKLYDIHIVTIGNTDNLAFKNRWIESNLPFIDNVILIRNEGVKMNKSMINMEDGIFIDDVKDNLDSTNAKIKICFGEIYDWNKGWDGARYYGWGSLLNSLYILKKVQ